MIDRLAPRGTGSTARPAASVVITDTVAACRPTRVDTPIGAPAIARPVVAQASTTDSVRPRPKRSLTRAPAVAATRRIARSFGHVDPAGSPTTCPMNVWPWTTVVGARITGAGPGGATTAGRVTAPDAGVAAVAEPARLLAVTTTFSVLPTSSAVVV